MGAAFEEFQDCRGSNTAARLGQLRIFLNVRFRVSSIECLSQNPAAKLK